MTHQCPTPNRCFARPCDIRGTLYCYQCSKVLSGTVNPPEPFIVTQGQIKAIPDVLEGWLILPYPPATNNLYATGQDGKRYKTQEAKDFREEVHRLTAHVHPLTGEVCVTIRLYRPRMAGDTDGRLKALLDALTGIAYADDEQVGEIHVYRFLDRERPRAEVLVVPRKVEE